MHALLQTFKTKECLSNIALNATTHTFGGSLESPQWSLLDFYPKILKGGMTYKWIFVILWMQVQWWRYHEVMGVLKPYLMQKSFLHLQATGMQNQAPIRLLAPEPPGELFTIFIWYHGQGVCTCKESLPWPKNLETNHCKSNRWLIRICGTLLILSWHLRHVLEFNKLGQRAEKIFHDNLRTFNQ